MHFDDSELDRRNQEALESLDRREPDDPDEERAVSPSKRLEAQDDHGQG